MSLRWVVVHEAQADFRTATELADRVILQEVAWLDEEILGSQRAWVDRDAIGTLSWKSIPERARALGIAVRGHFNDQPGQPDAQATRRALLFIQRVFDQVDAVVLIRDSDNRPERRTGLEQARAEFPDRRIVIGLAEVERECWVLCGFDPDDDEERARLDAERKALGFDPTSRSHELTACGDPKAKRSPKRVLAALTRGVPDREARCWQTADLVRLRERGRHNGLVAYLNEIRTFLIPALTDRSA